MKLYYQEKGIEIWHGDCRDWGGDADVLITDPPYGVGFSGKSQKTRAGDTIKAEGGYLFDDSREYVRRVVVPVVQSVLDISGRGAVTPGTKSMWLYPEPSDVGSWFSAAGTGISSWGFRCSQPILWYGKDPYQADGLGARANSFGQTYPNDANKAGHPCAKPIRFVNWLVNRASRPGETILDPFMGSGTTLRAAKDLGRKAIGIEIEERYCEIAAQRLEQEVLFSPEPEPEHEQLAL